MNRWEKDAEAYFDHLTKDGPKEPIEDREMELPPWFDQKEFERCQSIGLKHATPLFMGMLYGTEALLVIPTIVQVLMCTGQSGSGKMAYRRYLRTVLHISSWYKYPLQPGSRSWESLETVRGNHTRADRICSRKRVGQITQKDLVLTQFGLISISCLGGFRPLISDLEFQNSTMYMWHAIGHMLGIRDEYNICKGSWAECRPRFEMVMERIIKPGFDNPGPNFEPMGRHMVDGYRAINSLMTYHSSLYIAKWVIGCEGYEFFESDFQKTGKTDDKKFLKFYELSAHDRFVTRMVCFTLELSKIKIFMVIFNFLFMFNQIVHRYFPMKAIQRFGYKWAYVRIFKDEIKTK